MKLNDDLPFTEPINPKTAMWRAQGQAYGYVDEDTRRGWRKMKRNNGKKNKTLRSHRPSNRKDI